VSTIRRPAKIVFPTIIDWRGGNKSDVSRTGASEIEGGLLPAEREHLWELWDDVVSLQEHKASVTESKEKWELVEIDLQRSKAEGDIISDNGRKEMQ
jgi:hypothetical protein